ncbi:MAG: hypothetical protein ACXAC5_01540 [Promethearchaeota archaeon]
MLSIISKQAQFLTTRNDAELAQPFRQLGRGIRQHMRERGREKQRQRWNRQRQEAERMRDPSLGVCRVCGLGLVPSSRGAYCPNPVCNPPRHRTSPVSLGPR